MRRERKNVRGELNAIRVEQMLLLVQLVEGEPMKYGKTELAEFLGSPHHAYYMGMLDTLEALGLIAYEPDTSDHKRILCRLTSAGRMRLGE